MSVRVSVLIPYFNAAATIHETLASVPDRDWVEVIICDDASDDPASVKAFDELEAPWGKTTLKKARRTVNSGPGPALNSAAELMDPASEYLIELDADDQLLPGALEDLVTAMDRDPSLDLAWGNLVTFGLQEGKRRYGAFFDPWLCLYKNPLPCCTMMRRSSWERAGGWRVAFPGIQDWGMWLAMAEIGARGRNIGRDVLRYRVSEQGLHLRTRAVLAERREATLSHFAELVASEARLRRKSRCNPLLRFLLPRTERLPVSSFRRSRLAALLLAGLWAHDWPTAYSRLRELIRG